MELILTMLISVLAMEIKTAEKEVNFVLKLAVGLFFSTVCSLCCEKKVLTVKHVLVTLRHYQRCPHFPCNALNNNSWSRLTNCLLWNRNVSILHMVLNTLLTMLKKYQVKLPTHCLSLQKIFKFIWWEVQYLNLVMEKFIIPHLFLDLMVKCLENLAR